MAEFKGKETRKVERVVVDVEDVYTLQFTEDELHRLIAAVGPFQNGQVTGLTVAFRKALGLTNYMERRYVARRYDGSDLPMVWFFETDTGCRADSLDD